MSAGTAFAADSDDSGSAYAVRASATLLNSVTAGLPVQNKVVYSHGKGDERSMPNVDSKPLKAKGLHTSAKKEGAKVVTDADVADVDALEGFFRATLVEASCTKDANGDLHGDAKIVDAVAGGMHLSPSNPQSINLLGGTAEVRVNEQVKDKATGVLTVNAIHIILGGALQDFTRAEVFIAQAKCSANDNAALPLPGEDNPPVGIIAPTSSSVTTSVSVPATSSPAATTPATSSSAAAAPKLPNTGANVAWLAGGAVILLGGGAGALWWARRRNAASHG
jgi:LPXTG-motif cell wall-anchored protein